MKAAAVKGEQVERPGTAHSKDAHWRRARAGAAARRGAPRRATRHALSNLLHLFSLESRCLHSVHLCPVGPVAARTRFVIGRRVRIRVLKPDGKT